MLRTLPDLLEGWVQDAPGLTTTGISLDNRTIKAGEAFIAVQGQLNHGLEFATAAVDAGAVAVIHDGLQPVPALDVPCIRVDGLGRKLGELASRFYAAPSELMSVAAVTGSSGKTAVTHFLAQSWQRAYGQAGMVGRLGHGPLGKLQHDDCATPDALRLQQVLSDCVAEGVEHLAMEVSARALQQRRIETVQVDAAIFTDLTRGHRDHHVDMAEYAAVKRQLFTEYAPAFAIINHDDEYGRRWFAELNGGMQMLSYGLGKGAELSADIRSVDKKGMVLRINGPWGAEDVRTGLLGEFNASNLLAAAGVLCLLGMRWHRVLNQLELMQPVPGGMIRRGGERDAPVAVNGNERLAYALESVA
jgi:UDP-N-acetylmuramoyl-L-alanyl-D-glutamate--2,6-diaminopimelate ligase